MLSRRLLRIKVIKALYAHIKGDVANVETSVKNLRYSIDKTYDLYFQTLWLIVEVRRYAESRIEIGRNKKLPTPEELNPNTKFVDNALIAQIEHSDAVVDYIKAHNLGWSEYPDLIRDLYNKLVETDFYKKYMALGTRTYKGDASLVRSFYAWSELEDSERIESVLEEQSILWNDDFGFALIMAVRTVEDCRASQSDVPVLPEFRSDDDLQFALTLFRKSAAAYAENMRTVERFITNWDVDRIAFMDNLIMSTALAEMLAFPDIPTKVTLDEFIEIAKYYSTPGSNVFINGVLDKLTVALTAEGVITKSGRGLQ